MALSRGAAGPLLAELAGHFHPVALTYADWPGGAVRVHSGAGALSWGGFTWSGVGRFVQWQAPAEEMGLAASAASVHVAGTLEDVLAEVGVDVRGRTVEVYWGATTTAGGTTLVGTPVLLLAGVWSGRRFAIAKDGASDQTHDLILDAALGPWVRAMAHVQHSYEDQLTTFPGDTAGRFLQNMAKQAVNPPQIPEP